MVLIHIGYSKCASTTLQEMFECTDSIEYLHKPEIFEEKDKKVKLREDWLLDVCQHKSEKPVVVSHEHLLLSKLDPTFGVSSGGKKEAEDLIHLIDKYCDDYSLLLIVREQSKMIASRYLQYIMQGGKSKIVDFVAELLPVEAPFKNVDYRFNLILDTLHSGKTNKIICCDVSKISTDGFINQLNGILGTKINRASNERNVAVSRIGAAIIRLINMFLVKEKETYSKKTETRGPYMLWLILIVIVRKLDNLYSQSFGRSSVMKASMRKTIEEYYANDNNLLKEKYGIDFAK